MPATREMVGVVGGLGPLASAAFVSTVYERTTCLQEQDMPRLALVSDPAFPDRTSALLEGREDVLARHLTEAVEQCLALGAGQVVICCMTVHAVLDRLPLRLRERVVSLVDVFLDAVVERQQPQLLVSSSGTRRARIFERHPRWDEAAPWLSWPDEAEQEQVHRAIYALKRRNGPPEAAALIGRLLRQRSLRSFAAACTELHLVTRYWADRRLAPVDWIDPLEMVAERLAAPLAEAAQAGAR